MATPRILVINPGSSSTKVALFNGDSCHLAETLLCNRDELDQCATVRDQIPLREKHVTDFLKKHAIPVPGLSAIVARGGPLRAMPGGVYSVNDAMLADAQSDQFVEHVSRIACVVAAHIGRPFNVPAFVVDPVSTDEFDAISRISGLKEVPRKSLTHALNMKAVAREYTAGLGRAYAELNLITAHMGGGTSLAVHHGGRMIDAVDGNGEGPFSPERSGGLRVDDLASYILDNGLSAAEVHHTLTRAGGLMSHLGTTDACEVEQRVIAGDEQATLIFRAMAYSMAKHICALAAAVNGQVDAVLLTGGLAHSDMLMGWIRERVSFLAPVVIIPGEREMAALARGAWRVLTGDEQAIDYPGGDRENLNRG